MKNRSAVFLIIFFYIITSISKELESDIKIYSCSILYSSIPLSVSGLRDVHVSDWELYGTGVMEGRAEVNLSESNTENNNSHGAVIEIGYKSGKLFGTMLEIPFTFNKKSFSFGLNYGFKFYLLSTNRFSLGVVPKSGFRFVSLSGTKVVMLPNKTPPIITKNYTFYEGDPVSGGATGGTFAITVESELRVHKKYSITGNIGYQTSIFSKPNIWIGKDENCKEFKISDPEIIEVQNNPNGTVANANFTGQVEGKGIIFSIGLKILYYKPQDDE
ncbi:MAG: hypothetical protein PVI26_02820 [Chitinispirillia bacterium]